MNQVVPPSVFFKRTKRRIRFSIYGTAMTVDTVWSRKDPNGPKQAEERTQKSAARIAWRIQEINGHLQGIALEMAELRSLPKSDPL